MLPILADSHSLLIIPVVLLLASHCHGHCPPLAYLSPCECANNNLIHCANIDDQSSLSPVFSALHRYVTTNHLRPIYDEFKLVDSGLQQLTTPNITAGIAFKKITIQRNYLLQRISSETFASMHNVTSEILLEDNVLLGSDSEDNRQLFDGINRFVSLTNLHITECGITHLPERAFHRAQPLLSKIFLTENKLERIDNDAFSGLESLELINLDGNKLSKLAPRSLSIRSSPSKQLLRILMRSNHLTEHSFAPHMFTYTKRQIYLNLNYNKISHLPKSVFESFFVRKSVLTLANNPLICDCSFKWLVASRVLYNSSEPNAPYLLKDYRCQNEDLITTNGAYKKHLKSTTELSLSDFDQCEESDDTAPIDPAAVAQANNETRQLTWLSLLVSSIIFVLFVNF